MLVNFRKSTLIIFMVAVVASSAGVLFGFDLVIISGSLNFIKSSFSLFHDQVFLSEIVVSSVPGGAFLGSVSSYYSSEKIGRKFSILVTAVLFFLGTLLVVFSFNILEVIIGRLVMGFAVGLSSTIVPMYLAEISIPSIRGTVVFLYQLAITVGIALGFLVNFLFQSSGNWRLMFSVGFLPAIFLGLGIFLLPKSPRWLLTKGRLLEAREALSTLRNNNGEIEDEILLIQESVNNKNGGIRLLFSKKIRPLVFISVLLFAFQQLTGINSIFYYAPEIFKKAGFLGNSASLVSFSIGIMFFVSTIFGVFFVDKLGRRLLLLMGTLGISLSQFIQGIALMNFFSNSSIISLTSALFSIGCYAFSITGIAYIIMSEIFPLNIRTIGMAFANCSNWGFNMIISSTFLTFANFLGGMEYIFWFYSIMTLFGFLFVYFFIPETKGCNLENIEKKLYSNVRIKDLGV